MPENQIVSKFGRKISNSLISSASREHSTVIRTNSYILNKVCALQKKLQQCGQEHLYFQMKPNKNFVIRLSTSAYELAKLVVIEHLHSESFCKDYCITSCINEDECQNQVGSSFRVFNRKKDGMQGTKLKFTVNFYHTTSSVLVNGTRVDIFESELFQPICDSIQLKCTELTIVNEQIADALSAENRLTLKNALPSQDRAIDFAKANENEVCNTPENDRKETSVSDINLADESETEKIYFCPACEQSAQIGSIACEECGEWFHFGCVGLSDTSADTIHTDMPFICIYCNDNLLYNDSNTQDIVNEDINPSQPSETETTAQPEYQSDNTYPKQLEQNDNKSENCELTGLVASNIQDNGQSKKQKTKKTNNINTNKKQASSDANETLIAQKYYISSLESKVNHLENTVNLLQNTLEKNPQVSSSTGHQAPTTCTEADGVFACRQIEQRLEHRFNQMENQMTSNMYMQNQMTLQDQMNLQSLFHCQNQLIIGLSDRQCNPYARIQPSQGFQYLNQVVHPMGYQYVVPGLVRPPPMYQHPVTIPPLWYPQQATYPVTPLQPTMPGPVYAQQQRMPDRPIITASSGQFVHTQSYRHPAAAVPLPTQPPTQLPAQPVNINTQANGNIQLLPQTLPPTAQNSDITDGGPHGQHTLVDSPGRVPTELKDGPKTPGEIKAPNEGKDCGYSSSTAGEPVKEGFVDLTITPATPETRSEGATFESGNQVNKDVTDISTSKTSGNPVDQCKDFENPKGINPSQNFLSIPSLKENPPEIEPLDVEVYPDINRH